MALGLVDPTRIYQSRIDNARGGAWHTYIKMTGPDSMTMYNTDDDTVNTEYTRVDSCDCATNAAAC